MRHSGVLPLVIQIATRTCSNPNHMKTTLTPLCPIIMSIGIGLMGLLDPSPITPEPAARLIYSEILVEGKQMFHSSTSDDGHPNVDVVWGYIPELQYEATPAFEEAYGQHEDGDEVTFSSGSRERTIDLRIAYGGLAHHRELKLVLENDKWRVPAKEAERQARRRWITRDSVKALCK